jgi:hypothetical protein
MTKLLGLPLTLLLLAGLACGHGKGPGATTAPPDQNPPDPSGQGQIRLTLGQSATIGRGGWTIAFAAVPEDSRCPANVVCPWMGNGRVRLELVDADGGVTPLFLNTSSGPRGTVVDGMQIDLLELLPYPQDPGSIRPDEYNVVLSVTEASSNPDGE